MEEYAVMKSLDTALRRLKLLKERLKPRMTRTPFLVINPDTGADLEGWEEHNRSIRELTAHSLLAVKEYHYDPNIEGTLP
jgi:hypothetical protein